MSQPAVRPLSAQLQAAAIKELNEVPERVAADIEALRTWIQQQPHLRARDDDQFLLSFLRGCKFSLEKAKSKIDKFYTLRTKYPEFFTINDVNEKKVRELINTGILVYLPTPLNEDGPRIAVVTLGTYSVDKYYIEDVARTLEGIQEIFMLEDDNAVVYGITTIVDVKKGSTAHLMHMSPSSIKKMTVFSEEALPFRTKATHFINIPNGFETFFNVFKHMLSKKLQKRLSLHGNKLDKLYEHIPLKYLPKDYGGENGSIAEGIADLNQKLDAYREYFKANAQYGTDEKLRPGKPLDFDEIFGVQGSFRKLEVD
ncbi:PREDICTED: alpha-tocopherol transfer protein-like [Bactrocera latifrons]|uniref:Alpha-tocopherol transfer protein-like n=1 Tax=Bactrocera latifrons TaxID=174628 RepID=A0A0K8V0J2_BACLA|nr:PREDICTED: alpha-tocopherol transfer protein-like [Bactrocera latifrons]